MRVITILLAGYFLSGCALLVPYDSKFACEKTDDYGRCINVNEAYDDALAPSQSTDNPNAKDDDVVAARAAYKAAEYREMANLINDPVTPIIQPPKLLRTLVVAYPGENQRTLYSPRWLFYVVEDATFVLGDYLNAPSANTRPVLDPFKRAQ